MIPADNWDDLLREGYQREAVLLGRADKAEALLVEAQATIEWLEGERDELVAAAKIQRKRAETARATIERLEELLHYLENRTRGYDPGTVEHEIHGRIVAELSPTEERRVCTCTFPCECGAVGSSAAEGK